MNPIGLDLNATRVRAVAGPQPGITAPVRLDRDTIDLPLALGLDGRTASVGRAGAALTRRLPHLACLDFLGHLGSSKRWSGLAGSLDADDALSLVLKTMRPAMSRAPAIGLAIPPYLGDEQIV